MPPTPEQIKIIKNHIPTIEHMTKVFINVLDLETEDPEEKYEYLISMIDTMEAGLAEVKAILQTQL